MSSIQFHGLFDSASNIVRKYGVFIVATFLISFGAFFVLSGRGEITDAIRLVTSINPLWVLVLAAMQAVTLLIAGWTYQVVLKRQGYSIGLWRLIEIHFRRIVIGAVTPVGGPASIYVLVRSLRAHHVRDSDSLILASIRAIGGVLAFLLFLIPVLLLQRPTTLVAIATAGLFLSLGATLWIAILVLRQRELPDFLHDWAPQRLLTFVETAKAHRIGPGDFIVPTALCFGSHVVTAAMLFVGLQAVGFAADISTVLIGYVVGKLFFMMAPVFQGIGIVEIGMVIALQQAGVPAAFAVGGALMYRVGDLWLPLSWGFVLQLIRTPVKRHLREAGAQASGMVTVARSNIQRQLAVVSDEAIRFGRLAAVTESPLALMYGAILILAGGLPFVG